MEIELSVEQRLLRDTCREFADRELIPNAKRWDREHRYPAEAVKKAFELGLSGVAVPPGGGGGGMGKSADPPPRGGNSPRRAPVGVAPPADKTPLSPPAREEGAPQHKGRGPEPLP